MGGPKFRRSTVSVYSHSPDKTIVLEIASVAVNITFAIRILLAPHFFASQY
jgi:hypothetical protein